MNAFFSYEDCKKIFKRYRQLLFYTWLTGALVGLLAPLLTPLLYHASSTFREGSTHTPTHAISQMFSTAFEKNSSIKFLLRSHTILRDVVQKSGLQVHVREDERASIWRTLWDNLVYTIFHRPPLHDSFAFSDVEFTDKISRELRLVLQKDQQCSFFDLKNQLLAKGKIGEPIQGPDFRLTISHLPDNYRIASPYRLTISPLRAEIQKLKKHFEVRRDKEDSQILWLHFQHPNPRCAANTVNQIADSLLSYLVQEEEKITASQIGLLDDHRRKLEQEFDEALSLHVDTSKETIDKTGFMEVRQQVELVQESLSPLYEKLVALETYENNLKEVQTSYAKTGHDPLTSPDSSQYLANNDDSLSWPIQFSGIDLATAKELHTNYQKDLDQIEGHLNRIVYLLPQIQDKNFNLHSIGVVFQDAVTSSLVQEATQLALSLNEIGNYSQKDQERVQASLTSQREFIFSHLQQIEALYKNQTLLLQKKLCSLRSVMLSLLDQEKEGVRQQMRHLQRQLLQVPEQWKLEKKLEAKSTMMKKVVEGVSQVIEGKIVEHHLKTINSKTIDPALLPDAPLPKKPLLIASLSSVGSAFMAYLILFAYQLQRGIPLSFSTAAAYGVQSAGRMSRYRGCAFQELPKSDLEITRHVLQFIEENKEEQKVSIIGVLGLNQDGWAFNLAEMLSLSSKKVLLVDLSFPSRPSGQIRAHLSKAESEGILPFLQKKREYWSVVQQDHYDWIPSGGYTRYATELLRDQPFASFLKDVAAAYDYILLVSETPLDASETLCLQKKCDLCAAFISEESYDCLQESGFIQSSQLICIWTE